MKIIKNIQLITFPAHPHVLLRFNKITNFDQIHTFPVEHIPFSINKLMYQHIFFTCVPINLVKPPHPTNPRNTNLYKPSSLLIFYPPLIQ